MRRARLLVALLTSSCTWLAAYASEAKPRFPPGVGGYACILRQTTPGGVIEASAVPDYRGGYSSFTFKWESARIASNFPFANGAWTGGPEGIAPPGWFTFSHTLDDLPPIHSRIRVQLSGGDFQEQDFVEPKDWKSRKRNDDRFLQGGNVFVHDPAFIEKFTQADWAEISVVDAAGKDIARVRYDLEQARESLAILHKMGEQVMADAADYSNRCTPYPEPDPIDDIT